MGDSSILFVTDDDLQALRNWKNLRVVTHDGIVASLTGSELSIGNSDYRKRFPQGGGGGVGVKTAKVTSVTTDHFVCKDVDADGVEVGDPFDVWPWVVDNGPIATGYILTSITLPRVIPKYTAGKFIRVYSSQLQLRQLPTGEVPSRWWAVDDFHLIQCNA